MLDVCIHDAMQMLPRVGQEFFQHGDCDKMGERQDHEERIRLMEWNGEQRACLGWVVHKGMGSDEKEDNRLHIQRKYCGQ